METSKYRKESSSEKISGVVCIARRGAVLQVPRCVTCDTRLATAFLRVEHVIAAAAAATVSVGLFVADLFMFIYVHSILKIRKDVHHGKKTI